MALLLAGRLLLLEPLGEGGTSTVRRAFDVRRARFRAAKLLPRSTYDARDAGPRIVHPHVLAVEEVLLSRDLVVLLMPLARGGTADRLLAQRGVLRPDVVGLLLDQLLDALGAVHGSGLVHGDVKPANLLLDATGNGRLHLRLADLGAAVPIGAPLRAATDGYLAPEAAAGGPADRRHDLFAAGATAVELLTGRLPPISGRRGPLARLLLELTDADPGRRPRDTDDARARLRTLRPGGQSP